MHSLCLKFLNFHMYTARKTRPIESCKVGETNDACNIIKHFCLKNIVFSHRNYILHL